MGAWLSSQRTHLHNQKAIRTGKNAIKLGQQKTDTRVGICRRLPAGASKQRLQSKNCISVLWAPKEMMRDAVALRASMAKFKLMTNKCFALRRLQSLVGRKKRSFWTAQILRPRLDEVSQKNVLFNE